MLSQTPAATARPGTWYWGEGRASARATRDLNARLIQRGANETVVVTCFGVGREWRGLYKHFQCRVLGATVQGGFKLHVLSKQRYTITNEQVAGY